MNASDSHYQYLQNPAYSPVNAASYSYPPAFEMMNNDDGSKVENEEKNKNKIWQKFYNVRSKGKLFTNINDFFFFFLLQNNYC